MGCEKKIKSVFMGTPDFSVPALRALYECTDLLAVYTPPDKPIGRSKKLCPSPVKICALELDVPVVQPITLKTDEEVKKLKALNPDIIGVVAYGYILKPEVIQIPRLGCINLHASILPRWRGAAPIQWALLAGDKESGLCSMRIAPKVDAGDVLIKKKISIAHDETATSLHDKLSSLGFGLMKETVEGLVSGSISPQVQDELKVTFAHKLEKEMQWLGLDWAANQMERVVRALNPWPGVSVCEKDCGRLKILKAGICTDIQETPGKIFEKMGKVYLSSSKGALELLGVQWEGKGACNIPGFINGLCGKKKDLPLTLIKKCENPLDEFFKKEIK